MNIVIGIGIFAVGWYINKKVAKWKEEISITNSLFK